MSGGGSSGGGDSTTTTKTEPWQGQKRYLNEIFQGAKRQYDTGPMEYYQGEAIAPFSPETESALAAQTQRAQTGSPVTAASQEDLAKTISGQYLDAGNPYFEQMAGRVRAEVQPNIDARFAAAGAGGSPLANRALGLGLGDAIGGLAYQNYGDERQRQMQGVAMSPQIANQDYFDISRLAEVGAARENLTQQQINDQIARHEFEQMEPWQRLGLYNQMIQGNYGGSSTSVGEQQVGGRSPVGAGLTGALGGAAMGATVGSVVPGIGTGIGAGVGAGLGALAGLV